MNFVILKSILSFFGFSRKPQVRSSKFFLCCSCLTKTFQTMYIMTMFVYNCVFYLIFEGKNCGNSVFYVFLDFSQPIEIRFTKFLHNSFYLTITIPKKNIRHLPLVNWFFGKWVKIDLFCAILWNFNFHNFCPTSCRIWKIFWKKGSVPLTVLMMYHSAILL